MKYTKKKILKDYAILMCFVRIYRKKKRWNKLIDIINLSARYAYTFNFKYTDDELEEIIVEINNSLLPNIVSFRPQRNKYIFYDSFALINRGISTQYINALKSWNAEFLYIVNTELKLDDLNEISSLIKDYPNASIAYINHKLSNVKKVTEIYNLINEFKPGNIFMYLTPWDVVALCAFHSFSNVNKYNINLTDHAFWLGTKCLDYNLEFRNYGASVSFEQRGLKKEQLLLQPFYPIISQNIKFAGFPVQKKNNDVLIFSGGAYYKIYGNNNFFFKLIKEILTRYQNVLFFYAGWGDEKPFQNFIKVNNFESKVYLLGLREDINEILKKIDIYIGTYPISGGLMTQYAAINSKPIITLIDEDEPPFCEEMIGHNFSIEDMKIEFHNVDDLLIELDLLMDNKIYREKKGKILGNAVLNEKQFNTNLKKIISFHKNLKDITSVKVDYDRFLETCIQIENTQESILIAFFFRKALYLVLSFFGMKRTILFLLNNIKKSICIL